MTFVQRKEDAGERATSRRKGRLAKGREGCGLLHEPMARLRFHLQ